LEMSIFNKSIALVLTTKLAATTRMHTPKQEKKTKNTLTLRLTDPT